MFLLSCGKYLYLYCVMATYLTQHCVSVQLGTSGINDANIGSCMQNPVINKCTPCSCLTKHYTPSSTTFSGTYDMCHIFPHIIFHIIYVLSMLIIIALFSIYRFSIIEQNYYNYFICYNLVEKCTNFGVAGAVHNGHHQVMR